jgi:hypothetical protein
MKEPGLDDRHRDENGRIDRKRNDTLAKNLRPDYPEFDSVRGNMKLGNIKKDLGLPPDASLKDVRKKLR